MDNKIYIVFMFEGDYDRNIYEDFRKFMLSYSFTIDLGYVYNSLFMKSNFDISSFKKAIVEFKIIKDIKKNIKIYMSVAFLDSVLSVKEYKLEV